LHVGELVGVRATRATEAASLIDDDPGGTGSKCATDLIPRIAPRSGPRKPLVPMIVSCMDRTESL